MRALALLVSLLSFSALGDTCPDLNANQQNTTVTKLAEQIYQYDVHYFEQHAPLIGDSEYDELERRLKFLEECFPDIPINRYKPAVNFNKAKHHAFMGSLKKAVNIDDVKAFLQKFSASNIIIQPKIDGIAVELIYEKGFLTEAITRGDGEQGESIIRHVQHMPLIPKELPDAMDLVLHGELFTRLDLVDENILKSYTSARHLVAGQVNRITPEPAVLKTVDFFPWRWIDTTFDSEIEMINKLNRLGFQHSLKYSHSVGTLEDIIRLRQLYATKKDDIFLMDGIVIKSASIAARQNIDQNKQHSNWALAWKFPAITAVTTVVDIEFSKGKTGKITPVLILLPVTIEGRVIRRVSLGSVKNYRSKNVAIGDQVSVMLKGAATPVFGQVILRDIERQKAESQEKK